MPRSREREAIFLLWLIVGEESIVEAEKSVVVIVVVIVIDEDVPGRNESNGNDRYCIAIIGSARYDILHDTQPPRDHVI